MVEDALLQRASVVRRLEVTVRVCERQRDTWPRMARPVMSDNMLDACWMHAGCLPLLPQWMMRCENIAHPPFVRAQAQPHPDPYRKSSMMDDDNSGPNNSRNGDNIQQ